MNKPRITEHDALTGVTSDRDMTDDEIAALVADGWTEDSFEPKETELP